MPWGFYGRSAELASLTQMIGRGRWFFAKLTGRRRIGKTTLINEAIKASGSRPVFYVQIPDSGPAGVLAAVADAMESFGITQETSERPKTLSELARMVGRLADAGYVVVLDEFQYFNRAHLAPFCSFLQAEIDAISARAHAVSGGLVVLGSIHTEMMALLEDRSAPLYNRTTDDIQLPHLDIASVCEILREQDDTSPDRLLFLWTLFEGVPKFYRDCYEQDVLRVGRETLLRRMFFESSSPLRSEADNWFLKDLRGRYDVVLKFIARHNGCMHNELVERIREISGEESSQVGGYLKVLTDKYRLIEKRLPIFAKPRARQSRYYLADNFLRAWLAAISSQVAALAFRPVEEQVATADQRLCEVEGKAFEKLVGLLYEERSRKGLGDFPLTSRIEGYWDRSDTEIDLVALNEESRAIRFGSCKRYAERLVADTTTFDGHVGRFLDQFPKYRGWAVQRVCLAPVVSNPIRAHLQSRGYLVQDLADLTSGWA